MRLDFELAHPGRFGFGDLITDLEYSDNQQSNQTINFHMIPASPLKINLFSMWGYSKATALLRSGVFNASDGSLDVLGICPFSLSLN